MTKREALMAKINSDLAKFVEEEDLPISHHACYWKSRETIYCPYEIKGLDKKCTACIDEYLETDEEVEYMRQRIIFFSSEGKFLFSLPDGDFLKLYTNDGGTACVKCDFVSDTEAKFDGQRMKIADFVTDSERKGISFESMINYEEWIEV